MSSQHWSTAWEFRTPHFIVTLDTTPEDMDPADSFEFQEDIDAVRNGDVEWFCARAAVHLVDVDGNRGNIIAADYLGACAYASFADFRKGGYFPDMVASAVSEARKRMAELQTIKLRIAA